MPDHTAHLLDMVELEALTGYRRPSAQVRALRAMGIEHWVRPDGRPVVRADWRQALHDWEGDHFGYQINKAIDHAIEHHRAHAA